MSIYWKEHRNYSDMNKCSNLLTKIKQRNLQKYVCLPKILTFLKRKIKTDLCKINK